MLLLLPPVHIIRVLHLNYEALVTDGSVLLLVVMCGAAALCCCSTYMMYAGVGFITRAARSVVHVQPSIVPEL
jgi:hypothetical protein